MAQAAELGDVYTPTRKGSILVFEPSGQRVLPLGNGERLVLHDAGMIDRRAVALATVRTGDAPEDTDERLLLVDIATGDRTDLGSVGGWESGVWQARFVAGGVALILGGMPNEVEVRALDGNLLWEVPRDGLEDRHVVVGVDEELLLIETGFEGDEFEPRITVTRFDLATGNELGRSSTLLQLPPDDIEIGGGFCQVPDWAGDAMLCGQTYGGPLLIDPATGATTRFWSFETGVATMARSTPEE